MATLEEIFETANLDDLPYPRADERYISENLVVEALINNDFSKLQNCVVVPKQNDGVDEYLNEDIGATLFSHDCWTNRHLVRRINESVRTARFHFIKNNEMRMEAKWICASILWWSRDGKKISKLSSMLRNFEQIIQIYRMMEELNCRSIFWLNREPISQSFKEVINTGRCEGTTKNMLSALGLLCDFEGTAVGELGYYLKYDPRKVLFENGGGDSNQTYAMPYRIMMSIWEGVVSNVEKWKGLDHDLFFDLVDLYDDYNKWSDRHKYKKMETSQAYYWRDHAQARIKELHDRAKDTVLECVFYVSAQKRWAGFTQINPSELSRIYGRMALDCINCIQCMSGMRVSETKGLYLSSLKYDHGVVVFTSWLQKWAAEGGQREEWAAADFAAEAFNLLASVNKRVLGGEVENLASVPIRINFRSWLSQRKVEPMVSQRQTDWARSFADNHRIEITEADLAEFKILNPNLNNPDRAYEEIVVGAPWPLRAHQYRRSIAVHTKRLNLATGNDRNWQFKQMTQKITDWYESYCPDEVLPVSFVEEMVLADLEQSAALGVRFQKEGLLIGKGGEQLMSQRDKREHLQLFPNMKTAISLAKRKKTQLTSLGNGFYCMNGFGCDFKPVVQSSSCNPDCPTMVAGAESIPFWQEQYIRYTKLLDAAVSNHDSSSTISFLELERDFYKGALEYYGVSLND